MLIISSPNCVSDCQILVLRNITLCNERLLNYQNKNRKNMKLTHCIKSLHLFETAARFFFFFSCCTMIGWVIHLGCIRGHIVRVCLTLSKPLSQQLLVSQWAILDRHHSPESHSVERKQTVCCLLSYCVTFSLTTFKMTQTMVRFGSNEVHTVYNRSTETLEHPSIFL